MDIHAFILNSPEIQGWHSSAALTILINLLTCFQACALVTQTCRVYADRSTLGLSVITLVFYGFYFCAFFIYGLDKGSLNIVFSGSQFIVYIPLIIGLWKYGNIDTKRLLRVSVPLCAFIPPIMILTPWKEAFLSCLFAGIVVSLWLMYRELRNISGVGSVVIGFQFAFLANAIFWFFYGVHLGDMPLMIFNPIFAVLLIMIIMLYFNKKRAQNG